MSESLALTERAGAVRFFVRVVPRASQSSIEGIYGGALKVKIAAPPVDGAANEELVAVLAKAFDVARSRIRVVRGARSRTKSVEIEGVRASDIRLRIE
jgi:hypothetical protein